MELLPKAQLIRTGPVDHADWNYRPFLSFILRRRYALLLELVSAEPIRRLLEVGFGSGVFMPELHKMCEELYGIDVHPKSQEVQVRLAACGVRASLSQQDAARTSFDDRFFDAIVSVSSLEFIERIDDAARELARILKPGGRLVAVMPNTSPMLDFALRIATGEDAKRDYGDRRERVLPALLKHFRVLRTKRFPPIYTAYEFEPIERKSTPGHFESHEPQPESVR